MSSTTEPKLLTMYPSPGLSLLVAHLTLASQGTKEPTKVSPKCKSPWTDPSSTNNHIFHSHQPTILIHIAAAR
ncbi:hypothetical protein LIPSTDRAFT_67138 [Lipomyces starkeyi NRRL Y-11557]|uniref:Uncharacterized protein n=1 Tax=Lipomyces starkeyi NRRL Y-11557 TaxID=675824 RepID=A0A1E3QF08_LIPST|nr:hypothetical protein LIPSTDRAFT_67138 [Lipomyces starkeyi NRRL Y-11557]